LREHEGHTNGANGAAGEISADAESAAPPAASVAPGDPLPTISRKVLLDLRDALRAFLTLLETE
jgi:hypothetical protein